MGRAKAWMMEQEERGFMEADGHICPDCVEEPVLKQWVADNAEATECSFCGRDHDDAIAAPMDDFVGVVVDGIGFDWNHPDSEGILYIRADGGYQASISDTYDVLYDCGVSGDEDVIQALVDAIMCEAWVERGYYRGDDSQQLAWGWESFQQRIKHTVRFFFLEGDEHDDLPPAKMLATIAETIRRRPGGLELVRRIATGTDVFRVRIDDLAHATAEQIGTPHAEFATKSNRMSPAGIPMFYGAFDVDTAIAETRDPPDDIGKIMSIGTFRPLRDLAVLDLTELPPVPSVFDEPRRDLIHPLRFLRPFADDISRPIAHDGREHVEYVPTQVVTEYFRQAFRDIDSERLDGIAYASSRSPGGVAVVLFCEDEQCVDAGEGDRRNAILELAAVGHRPCHAIAG